MSDGELGFTPAYSYESDLPMPAGSVVQNSVMVVAYFDAEGQTRYGYRMKGDSTLSNVLGLLELAKADLLRGADL